MIIKSPDNRVPLTSLQNLHPFWWLFALRGGFAVIFSVILLYTSTLMGTLFFDPILLVIMGLLIGFFVFGNGVILSVATVFAAEHHRHVWRLILAESAFALALGVYIACALFISPRSVALLAGLLVVGNSCFAGTLAVKLRHEKRYVSLLALSAVIAAAMGLGFLLNQQIPVKLTTAYLSGFELINGVVLLLLASWFKGDLPVTLQSTAEDLAMHST